MSGLHRVCLKSATACVPLVSRTNQNLIVNEAKRARCDYERVRTNEALQTFRGLIGPSWIARADDQHPLSVLG